jgi:hypothetical protein
MLAVQQEFARLLAMVNLQQNSSELSGIGLVSEIEKNIARMVAWSAKSLV